MLTDPYSAKAGTSRQHNSDKTATININIRKLLRRIFAPMQNGISDAPNSGSNTTAIGGPADRQALPPSNDPNTVTTKTRTQPVNKEEARLRVHSAAERGTSDHEIAATASAPSGMRSVPHSRQ
jgi:hypothetical protein